MEAIRKDSAITKSSSDILFSLVFNETRVKGEGGDAQTFSVRDK